MDEWETLKENHCYFGGYGYPGTLSWQGRYQHEPAELTLSLTTGRATLRRQRDFLTDTKPQPVEFFAVSRADGHRVAPLILGELRNPAARTVNTLLTQVSPSWDGWEVSYWLHLDLHTKLLRVLQRVAEETDAGHEEADGWRYVCLHTYDWGWQFVP